MLLFLTLLGHEQICQALHTQLIVSMFNPLFVLVILGYVLAIRVITAA